MSFRVRLFSQSALEHLLHHHKQSPYKKLGFSETLTSPLPKQKKPKKQISIHLSQFLPYSKNPYNIVDIISTNLRSSPSPFSTLLHEVGHLLPYLGHPEIFSILLRLQSDSSTAFSFFLWLKKDLRITPSPQIYCLTVHILAFSLKFKDAVGLLSEIVTLPRFDSAHVFDHLVSCAGHCNWNPVVFDLLIKVFVRAEMVKLGLKSLKKMVGLGLVPNVYTFNTLLNGLFTFNFVDECWELYLEMGRLQIPPNTETFNILTHILCENGDVRKIDGFIEEMEEEGFVPDLVTYNTLIHGFCRKRMVDHAFSLYEVMQRRKMSPNLITYTILINYVAKSGDVGRGCRLFREMVGRGISPDIVCYNRLMEGLCKQGKMVESRFFLYDMLSSGVLPDSFTLVSMAEGYRRNGGLTPFLNLIVELGKHGVSIRMDVYDFVVVALCEEGRPFAAKSLIRRMVEDGGDPSGGIYNRLVRCFCSCGYPEEALGLREEMLGRGIRPVEGVYRDLVCAFCESGRNADGEALVEEMVGFGMLPCLEISRALICGYCREKKGEKAELLLLYFAEKFRICDTMSFNTLVELFCEDGDVERSLDLQDRMLKVGYVPNAVTCRHIIDELQRLVSRPGTTHKVHEPGPNYNHCILKHTSTRRTEIYGLSKVLKLLVKETIKKYVHPIH